MVVGERNDNIIFCDSVFANKTDSLPVEVLGPET